MSDVLILAAFLAFVIFLVAGKRRKYAAIAGWSLVVINLLTEVPEYLTLDNMLYPAIAVASVPFLAITILHLLRDEPIILPPLKRGRCGNPHLCSVHVYLRSSGTCSSGR